MTRMRSRWLIVAIAALLITPAGAVLAQNATNETDDTGSEDEPDTNESPEASEEADDDDDEEDDDEAEAEDDDEDADDEHRPDHAARRGSSSTWAEDEGTYTGDHLQVTVDEQLPGLRNVTYLDPEASVFASIQLEGELTYDAREHVLSGETDEHEFAALDHRGGQLTLEGDDDAPISLELADGVDVNESDHADDDDEAAYELTIDGNRTVWLQGEELAYDNGTFTLADDARLSASFPAEDDDEDDDDREDARDRREAGSQWDRSNETFQGEHVSFTLDANDTRIVDYALTGSTIPVFAEADLPDGNDTAWEAHGKHFEMRTDDERIRVVDVPPAVLEVRADDDPARVVLAEGVNATQIEHEDDDDDDDDDDEEERLYELSLAQNRTAWVSGEEIELDNGTFTVEDRLRFRTMPTHPGASGNQGPGSMPDQAREDRGPDDDDDDEDERGPPDHARAHGLDEQARTHIEQAKAAGQVGAEVHVGEAGEPVAVEMSEVRVNDAWTSGEGAGMQIEAPDDAPATTVTMTLDESALGNVSIADAPDELTVAFDNETIAMADDLDDVLDATDDGDEPEYLLLVGGEEVEVLVSVPHFSPHTVEVYQTQSGEETASSPVPGFGAVSLVLASGLAAFVAGTRRQH